MPIMMDGQLGAAVRQVRHADFFSAFLDDVINATKRDRGEILAIRIARAVLNRAGHTHVTLSLGKPRRHLRVVYGPVFAESIKIGCLEINVTKARRRASPEIGLAACCLASLPIPVGTGSVGIGNVMFE